VNFEAAWRRAAPWLDQALEHAGRTHGLDDVRSMVERGEAQFWDLETAAAVTLVQDEPLERSLLVWLAGGDLEALRLRLSPQLETWARGRGCRRMLIVGRPGWERALQAQGYAPLARVITKEL
jgi:hypothetical protein